MLEGSLRNVNGNTKDIAGLAGNSFERLEFNAFHVKDFSTFGTIKAKELVIANGQHLKPEHLQGMGISILRLDHHDLADLGSFLSMGLSTLEITDSYIGVINSREPVVMQELSIINSDLRSLQMLVLT